VAAVAASARARARAERRRARHLRALAGCERQRTADILACVRLRDAWTAPSADLRRVLVSLD